MIINFASCPLLGAGVVGYREQDKSFVQICTCFSSSSNVDENGECKMTIGLMTKTNDFS